MDSQFVRKVMIDSRIRKSGTPGSFTFELNRAITLPSKCAGFITDIELVHSWWTVDDHNEYLYFYEVFVDYAANPQVWNIRYHRAAIMKQNWAAVALTAELQTKINAQLVNGQRSITASYDANTGQITFGVAAVAPVLSGAAGAWSKLDLFGGTITANMALQSGYTYVDSSDGRTLEFTSWNGGPSNTARIFMTETHNTYTYTFQWDPDTNIFEPINNSDKWTPPSGFSWQGVYPASTDTDVYFTFLRDEHLLTHGFWTKYNIASVENDMTIMPYDQNNPRTINEILGGLGRDWIRDLGTPGNHPLDVTLVTHFINLLGESIPLYITSPSLTAFGTSLGPRGEHTIMKKINTKAPFGHVILDNLQNDQDYFVCGGTTLKTIKIVLVNSFGHPMNIQADWSFSLVFQQLEG